MVFRLSAYDNYCSRDNIFSNMAKLKKGWWCIEDECKHFTNPCRCAHPSIRKELGIDRLKLLRLQMCPVLTSLDACLIHKKLDVSGD